MFWIWVLNFVAGFLIDLFYVLWMKSVAKDTAAGAAVSSMLIGTCSMAGFLVAASGHWTLAIPYVLGLGFGTLVAMRWRQAFTTVKEWLQSLLQRRK